MLVLFLLACHHPAPAGDTHVVVDDTDVTDTDVTDTDGDTDTGTSVPDDGCADLYDQDVLPRFDLTMTPDDWSALQADYTGGVKQYHPATFTYGDETVDAMVRLKGNPGFSWFGEKLQFVVSFDEVDPDARFHGLRKLSLDASWYEPTLLRDRLSWAVMREVDGLPSTCANNAVLYVNGEYYGLYANIEHYDHEWLERVFGKADATGVLYKYGTDPRTNEEDADPGYVSGMLWSSDPAALAAYGDVDEWRLEWAAEAALGDDDGYWCCGHNFYVYDHPTRGLLFVPWDFDDDVDVVPYDEDPIVGYPEGQTWGLFQQLPFVALTTSPEDRAKYVDAVATVADAMDPDALVADVERWRAQIDDAFAADPHTSVGEEEHVAGVDRLEAAIRARRAFLDSWVACERGEGTDADHDGYDVCKDKDDGDATVHPGAAEACNGRDDDADGLVDDDPSCDECVRHDFDADHFLFCRTPRTRDDALASCEAHGGELMDAPATTATATLVWFDTWPSTEPWWWAGEPSGGQCAAYDPLQGGVLVDCAELHPSLCRVP